MVFGSRVLRISKCSIRLKLLTTHTKEGIRVL